MKKKSSGAAGGGGMSAEERLNRMVEATGATTYNERRHPEADTKQLLEEIRTLSNAANARQSSAKPFVSESGPFEDEYAKTLAKATKELKTGGATNPTIKAHRGLKGGGEFNVKSTSPKRKTKGK